MRWIGCLLLVVAAAGIGHLLALERERRVAELAALLHSLEVLETEVVYGLTLLADACRRVARDYPECRLLYLRAAEGMDSGETARTAWTNGLETYLRRSALVRDDLRSLEKVGSMLGLSSAADQKRHLQLARREIDTRLQGARERLPQVSRLCRTLGVCSGLAAALLLL